MPLAVMHQIRIVIADRVPEEEKIGNTFAFPGSA